MKKYLLVLALMLATVTFVFSTPIQKDNMEENKQVDHPKYEMTITQKGEVMGKIIVETFPEVAPKMCRNFDSLVTIGFYDGTAFHRVIPGFMIQGGDPNSKNGPVNTWGMGDPSQTKIPAEFSNIHHARGILSTARSQDPNSATSQFFIMTSASPHLDRQYTVFGKVLEGMDVADKIVNSPTEAQNRPVDKIEMKIKKL